MSSPAQAILWQIFWRARWGMAAAGGVLVLAAAFSQLLPARWTISIEEGQVPAVGWCFGVSCLFANVMLIAAFSMSGSDTRNVVYAQHMFVLPIRTSALVAWPLISGCITVVGFWLITAQWVFRASGIEAPLWWPGAAFALFLSVFQALAWTPFAQRWLHAAVTIAVLIVPVLALFGCAVLDLRLSERATTLSLLGAIPVAYLAARSGVARARRGDAYDLRSWSRFTAWLARARPVAPHPFRSADRAQLWYECRAHLIVPVFIACMLPCFLFVPALEPHNVNLGWRLLGIMLVAPVVVGMLGGGTLGSLVDPMSHDKSSTFLLVRPVSTWSIVRSKLVMAAIMTGAIWILFLGYASLLLLRPGFISSMQRAASQIGFVKAWGYASGGLLLLVLFTWKSIVETLWIGLSGRKWVETTVAIGTSGLILSGVAIGLWFIAHPQHAAAAEAAAAWLLGLLLVMKLIAAVCVVQRLLHFRWLKARGAMLLAATWLAVVVVLNMLAWTLVPAQHAAPGRLVPAILLFIPFARPAGALLALQWNRHR